MELPAEPAGGEEGKSTLLVYSSPNCKHCRAATALLTSLSWQFDTIDVTTSPDLRREMSARAGGAKSVPQIVLVRGARDSPDSAGGEGAAGERHLGGNAELQAMHARGELDATLAAAGVARSAPGGERLVVEDVDLPSSVPTRPRTSRASVAPAPPLTGPLPVVESAAEAEETRPARLLSNKKSFSERTLRVAEPAHAGRRELMQTVVRRMLAGDGPLVRSRMYRLRSYQHCFVGRQFVDWVVEERVGGVRTRDGARRLGADMMDARLMHHVCYSEPFRDGYFFYRLEAQASVALLNAHAHFRGDPRPAAVVAAALHDQLQGILAAHARADGRAIDYAALRESEAFHAYVDATPELRRVDLMALSADETKAFFINVYNALVIHGLVVHGHPRSAGARSRFFNTTRYEINGLSWSCNDIEHGVLRCNAHPPLALFRTFGVSDPRRVHVLVERDPRIHFALVCGAKSCPPIRVFSAAAIDEQLDLAAGAFLEDSVSVVAETATVTLSKLLSWYGKDFGPNKRAILEWVQPYLRPAVQEALGSLLASGRRVKVKFGAYDWSPNA